MPSRRDQVQSYQFFVQRMTSALVARDPDPVAAPFGRLGAAGLGGIMVAVLCLGAVGIFGFVVPGGATGWQDGDSVILEKETGTRYLYRDGHLHPVVNYASALLALESFAPLTRVSRNSLDVAPRGARIGIPDAPDALPGADRLLTDGWTLCSQVVRDQAGEATTRTVLTVGRAPVGGRSAGDGALLVRDADSGRLHLIWRDQRHELVDPEIVLEGLTLRSEPIVLVGGAWLNALPAGEPIGSRSVAGRGEPSAALPDAVTGEIYAVQNQAGDRQYYLAERARLLPLTELQAEVLLADPGTREAYDGEQPVVRTAAAATVVAAPRAERPAQTTAPAPERRPEIVRLTDGRQSVCAGYAPDRHEPQVLLDAQVESVEQSLVTPARTADGVPLADVVVIAPGHGALVEALPSPDAPAGTLTLVTDLGIRYPLADRAVAAMLGYPQATPVRLPTSLVVRLPAGPTLDPVAAKQPV
ncbi:type VII secretion protein EccB [Solwaraspora sp. WMMD791]|uniref:type VII secretion protein EccB n=1 Tax=Solwaraspora sp. WMMD791 TaxID=3016086 RepID=UPI00249BD4A7|nr:type VII secretion protein EccB [Solwaraspora sp. WMMD791]WFE25956.1 type VII secretion protein EccB [Solwaraspora sp. WMMD791]